MISWVAFLSVGILLGLVAGFYYSMLSGSDKKRLQELEVKLKEAENSMSGYKQNVTDHFVTTSNLINNMTESYRAIHDHMSTGAKTLCSQSLLDSPASQYQLDIPQATVPDSTSTEKQTAASSTNTESTSQEPETTATQDTPEGETTAETAEDINKTETIAAATDTNTDTATTSDISSSSESSSDKVNKTESLVADSKSTEDASNKETDTVTVVSQQLDIASIASAATVTSETIETGSDTVSEPADTIGKPIDIEEKEKPLLFDKKKDQNSNVIH